MAIGSICLAPLRGVTGLRFRQAFQAHHTGLDLAVAPFIATVQGDRVKPESCAALIRVFNPRACP